MAEKKKARQSQESQSGRKPWESPEIGEVVGPGEKVHIPTSLPTTAAGTSDEDLVYVTLSGSIGPRGGPMYGPGRVAVPRAFAEQLGVQIEGPAKSKGSQDEDDGEDYSKWSKEDLEKEADKRGLKVTREDGEEGDPLKSDYVAALEQSDAES
jgi:hypothetical protein